MLQVPEIAQQRDISTARGPTVLLLHAVQLPGQSSAVASPPEQCRESCQPKSTARHLGGLIPTSVDRQTTRWMRMQASHSQLRALPFYPIEKRTETSKERGKRDAHVQPQRRLEAEAWCTSAHEGKLTNPHCAKWQSRQLLARSHVPKFQQSSIPRAGPKHASRRQLRYHPRLRRHLLENRAGDAQLCKVSDNRLVIMIG